MKEVVLIVRGMTCASCVNAVVGQVEALEGVSSCDVSLVTSECKVVSEDSIATDGIIEAVEDCGFDCELIREKSMAPALCRGFIGIKGMTCSSCVATVTKQLEAIEGVSDVDVSLMTEECTVVFDPQLVAIEDIKETIDDCGFDGTVFSSEPVGGADSRAKYVDLRLLGFNSKDDNELDQLTDKLRGFKQDNAGILDMALNTEDYCLSVHFDTQIIGIRKIIDILESLGINAVVDVSFDKHTQLNLLTKASEIRYWKSACVKSCIVAFVTMVLYMGLPALFPSLMKDKIFPYSSVGAVNGLYYRDIIGFFLASYVQFVIGATFYKSAWASLKHYAGTMDTLVCFSTTCAYLFSLYSMTECIVSPPASGKLPKVIFDTSVMIVAYISIGKYLENKAKSKTSTALSKLISLTPSSCIIVDKDDDSITQEIGIELLEVGDIAMVKPGAKIPSDGIVTKGISEVDESLMTGETNLVVKEIGSVVTGGTINGSGLIYFEVTSVGDDTKLANIIKVMKNAQLKKASIQRYTDYVASIFVPTVLILSLLTFIVWTSLTRSEKIISKLSIFGETSESRFYMCLQIATSVVIVACPCALGLATPTAIMVGTGVASENGVLIKGGDVLEKFNEVNTFVFDKTGTLTTGHMTVQQFVGNAEMIENLFYLECIERAEALSDHPVSKAVVKYCRDLLGESFEGTSMIIEDEQLITGKGIKCTVKAADKTLRITVGNKSLMDEDSLGEFWQMYGRAGPCTVTYLAIDDKVCGRFELLDEVKSDAKDVIRYLRNNNYEVFMVTGDTHKSAMKVAEMVDIPPNNVYSEVTPDGKSQTVEYLREEGRVIAFIGDGINDSLALVTSDLGIAISSGTEVAIEAAGIVILNDPDTDEPTLKGVVNALDLSIRTFRRVKLNLFWALCYNVFMLPIAMGILVPWGITLQPMVAGLAMAFSSVSVVVNSLMLKWWKAPELTSKNSHSSKGYGYYTKGTEQLNRLLGSASTGMSDDTEIEIQDLELQPTSLSSQRTL